MEYIGESMVGFHVRDIALMLVNNTTFPLSKMIEKLWKSRVYKKRRFNRFDERDANLLSLPCILVKTMDVAGKRLFKSLMQGFRVFLKMIVTKHIKLSFNGRSKNWNCKTRLQTERKLLAFIKPAKMTLGVPPQGRTRKSLGSWISPAAHHKSAKAVSWHESGEAARNNNQDCCA